MEQHLLIDSDISIVDGDYGLLEALGLIVDDEETEIIDGDVKFEAEKDDDWDEFETDDDDEIYDEWGPLWRRCMGKTSSSLVNPSS